jgi:mycothiol system anti-sigma-R factor
MDCRTALALIDAYLDGELDRIEARALEAHLDGCPGCAEALAQSDALRRALRDPALRHAAPAALRERVHATLDASAQQPPPAAHRSRRLPSAGWWQLAAACVVAFAAGTWLHPGDRVANPESAAVSITHDLFASHWRALAAASPVDVLSSDHHTVKPWFAGRIADSPPVQDFAAQGFALVGGRIDYVGTQRVAVLAYRHGQHVIDVFILPQSASGGLPAHAESQGYWADTVAIGARRAVVVSDMDATERDRFARLIAAAR